MNTCCVNCLKNPLSSDAIPGQPQCENHACKCHQEKPNHEIEWSEIDRIKSLYRPILDMDVEPNVVIPPNFEAADKALDALLTHQKESIVSKLEGMKIDENFDGNWQNGYYMARREAIEVVRGI